MKFTNSLFNDLLTYWKSCCRENRIPSVNSFDLIDLPIVLPDITYWELEADGRVICRMAGTKVVERMNTDITGMYLDDLMPPEVKPLISKSFQAMQTHPCGLYLRSQNHHPSGRVALAEAFTLPLAPEEHALPKYITVNHQIETVGYENREEIGESIILGATIEKLEFVDVGWGAPEMTE